MTFAWGILILFLLAYASFSSAMVWHLNTYSFSRSAKWVANFFIVASLVLAVLAIAFFVQIDWAGIRQFFGVALQNY